MVCGQVNRCDDRYVYRSREMRVIGAVITIFAIIEFGIGGALNQTFLENPVASSWWSCSFFITAGTAALSSKNKGMTMVSCIAASIGILSGLVGSVTESAVAKIFERLLSCGTFTTYPPTVQSYNSPGASSAVKLYGAPRTYNLTTWCVWDRFENNKYSQDSVCYCSYDTTPEPLATRVYIDSCETLQFVKDGLSCDKIFTEYTPNLKASAGITALLTVLSFVLAVFACTALCCEVRIDDLPVIPAGGVQFVAQQGQYPAGVAPGGMPVAVGGYAVAGEAGHGHAMSPTEAKMAQAYYIDSSGQAVGLPTSAAGPVHGAVAGRGATMGGVSGPTVIAYATPVGHGTGTYALPPGGTNGP